MEMFFIDSVAVGERPTIYSLSNLLQEPSKWEIWNMWELQTLLLSSTRKLVTDEPKNIIYLFREGKSTPRKYEVTRIDWIHNILIIVFA